MVYIAKAIENYLSQACADSELIIVDGGSSDGTVAVIEAYANIHASITWISEKDQGQSDAMNKGIKLAKGKYISFLNVDDYYSTGCLEEVIEILINNPTIQYLVGDCNVWDQHGDLIYVNRPAKVQKWHVFSGYYFSVNPSAYFYRKSLHAQVGYYSLTNHYTMDLEMIFQFRKVTKFTYYPKKWGNFRMLPNTKTYEDQSSNQLELRKKEMVHNNLKTVSLSIQCMVYFYRIKKKYFPLIQTTSNKVVDKLKFEFNNLLIGKK